MPPTRTSSSQNMFALLNQTEDTEGTATPSQPEGRVRPKLDLAPRTKPLPNLNPAQGAGAGEESGKEDEADEEEDEEGEREPVPLSDEEAKARIANDVKEFLEIKDIKSGVQGFTLLTEDRRSQALAEFVDAAINKKEADVKTSPSSSPHCTSSRSSPRIKRRMPSRTLWRICKTSRSTRQTRSRGSRACSSPLVFLARGLRRWRTRWRTRTTSRLRRRTSFSRRLMKD